MQLTTRFCGATTKSEGVPCRRPVSPGFTRCNMHGGATPLARQAAAETLAAAALPAAGVLFDIVDTWKRTACDKCGMPTGDPSPVIRAAQIVLDRTGFGPSATLAIAPPPPKEPWAEWLTVEQAQVVTEFIADAKRRMRAGEPRPVIIDAYVVPEEGLTPPEGTTNLEGN